MAILQGEYNMGDLIRHALPNSDGERAVLNPERVKVTATPDEWARIGTLPDAHVVQQSEERTNHETHIANQTQTIPPDRDLVQHIARKVEVQVPDENLIDWMARGNSGKG